jgi:hypothetical protein
VKVRAGQFLRISVMVKRMKPTVSGVGGVIVRDSIGGEALQFVSNEPMPKKTRIVLYRRAPADGELTVTIGLAGYDNVFFDDFQIQRVEASAPPRDLARRPLPPRPGVATRSATPRSTAARPVR